MAADDGDVLSGGVGGFELRDEARSADYVESGDTEEAGWVVDALGFEDLGCDGDGGVDLVEGFPLVTGDCKGCWGESGGGSREIGGSGTHGVGDDEDVRLGRRVRRGFCEVPHDRCVRVE